MSFQEHTNFLGELETFDPDAFMADENFPEEVCSLMLSLATAYNDFRDVIFYRVLLSEIDLDLTKESPAVGQFNALANSALRIQAGLLNELFDLLKRNDKAINHVSFQKVVKTLSSDGRESWNALLEVSKGRDVKGKLGKALVFVRNKVAFHYDAKIISQGYKSIFKVPGSQKSPLISRGSSMKQSRFYFADAATQNYMQEQGSVDGLMEGLAGDGSLLEWVNLSLFGLVTRFPASRGFGWRKYNAPNNALQSDA